jgi:hypothetical protein
MLHIEADEEWVSLAENSVSSDGGAETVTIKAKFNNEIYPVSGSGLADGFAIRRIDTHTWKTRGFKAGEPVFAATLVLAPDGRSFREDGETTLSSGTRATASLVYERYDKDQEPYRADPAQRGR